MAAFLRHLGQPFGDREVVVLVIEHLGIGVAFGAGGGAAALAVAVAGQEAAGQRAPRHDANPFLTAVGDHLALFLAIHQVVLVLHGDEAGPAMPLGGELHLGELEGVHAGGPEIADLAGLHTSCSTSMVSSIGVS
jgi:hypothetical protein